MVKLFFSCVLWLTSAVGAPPAHTAWRFFVCVLAVCVSSNWCMLGYIWKIKEQRWGLRCPKANTHRRWGAVSSLRLHVYWTTDVHFGNSLNKMNIIQPVRSLFLVSLFHSISLEWMICCLTVSILWHFNNFSYIIFFSLSVLFVNWWWHEKYSHNLWMFL